VSSESGSALVPQRLPEPLRRTATRVLRSPVGGFGLRCWRRLLGIEVFDRSMSIAAQFFTSLIPLSIAVGTILGRDWRIGATLDLPPEAADIIDEAVSGSGGSFGLVGLVLVLVLATSLSRTLARLYCAVFGLVKPATTLRLAGRWLVALLSFFVAVGIARLFRAVVEGLPFDEFWFVVGGILAMTALWVIVPWLLVEGRLHPMQLLPGAALAGTAWLVIGAVGDVVLGPFLARSAAQYGVMGVAFTYLSWLYALSLSLVVAVAIGYELLPAARRTPVATHEPDRPRDVGRQ
jgi:membrane protein